MKDNDYELVFLAQENNEDAINILYEKYKPIIVKKSENAVLGIKNNKIEINDIIQEGYIGFDEAIRKFKQNDDASFYTFASLCIERKIINYLRKVFNKKNIILNDAINIDDNIVNYVCDDTDIEKEFIIKETKRVLNSNIGNYLTNFEKEVYDLLIKNYDLKEISKTLNKDIKSIYNTVDRIKQKIRKNMNYDL